MTFHPSGGGGAVDVVSLESTGDGSGTGFDLTGIILKPAATGHTISVILWTSNPSLPGTTVISAIVE